MHMPTSLFILPFRVGIGVKLHTHCNFKIARRQLPLEVVLSYLFMVLIEVLSRSVLELPT
jgi:hypothetical protein